MSISMVLSILKTVFSSKYFYIGLGIIFLGYLGLRIHLLKCTIEERDFTITQLKVNNSNLKGTIEALEQQIDDRDDSITNINKVLVTCYEQQQKQINDFSEIDTIMNLTDPVIESYTVSGTKPEVVKPEGGKENVSKATYTKGIDFINRTFDAIE